MATAAATAAFRWFYRTREPDHVIALCAGHWYLAGPGWQPGVGSLDSLGAADRCCSCMGTATVKRMRGAPLKPAPEVVPE